MKRNTGDFIQDMITYARNAIEFIGEATPAELRNDAKSYCATVRAIEVVGEAARRIPEEFKAEFPSVPWRELIAMRNILAHNYDGADPEIIHHTATSDFPALIKVLTEVATRLDPPKS